MKKLDTAETSSEKDGGITSKELTYLRKNLFNQDFETVKRFLHLGTKYEFNTKGTLALRVLALAPKYFTPSENLTKFKEILKDHELNPKIFRKSFRTMAPSLILRPVN